MRELAIARQDAREVPLQLEIFDRVPRGHIVHAVDDDRMEPLLRDGDVAIIEFNGTAGWYPVHGGLFLIEYVSKPTMPWQRLERRTRSVVQTNLHRGRIGPAYWWACPLDHGDARRGGRVMNISDGPYEEQHLAEKLLGPVVGVYGPSLRAI